MLIFLEKSQQKTQNDTFGVHYNNVKRLDREGKLDISTVLWNGMGSGYA